MQQLEQAILSLGTEGFCAGLLDYVNTFAAADHFALIRFDRAAGARILGSATRADTRIEGKDVQRLYLSRYCRHDPNWSALRAPQRRAEAQLRRLNPRSLNDRGYRHYCFEVPRLIDRLSILKPGGNSLYCLNLYRSQASGPFTAAEAEAIEQHASLLATLSVKQDQAGAGHPCMQGKAAKLGELRRRLAAIDRSLTARELQVAAGIVAGMSSEAIALELGLSANSVVTYRRRAYAKLGISTQNELFSLCYFG